MSPNIPQYEKSAMSASPFLADHTRIYASKHKDCNTESEAESIDNVTIGGVEDKALYNKDIKASTKPTKPSCPFLEKLPAEIRLKIYEQTMDEIAMDGDGTGLDGAVARSSILVVCKFVRDEAIAVYVNKVFGAILDMREKHIAVKKEMGKMVRAALRTRNEPDTRRHGTYALASAQLTFRHGNFCVQLSRYSQWLDRKIKSLKEEGFDAKPTDALMAKFKEMALLSALDVP